MKNKNFFPGFVIYLGICAAMLALTIPQILLLEGSKVLAVRTNLINILLAAAGMGALLWLGKGLYKKLNTLQELVRPLEKRDYSALRSLDSIKTGGANKEPYRELIKSATDLGKFIEVFKGHVKNNARMEELLAKILDDAQVDSQSATEALIQEVAEIETTAQQAISTLRQAEDYFSSFDEIGREQIQMIEEVDSRLSNTDELEQSLAVIL